MKQFNNIIHDTLKILEEEDNKTNKNKKWNVTY